MKEGESFLFSVIGQSRGRSIGCVGRGLIVRGRAGGGHKDRLPSPPPQTRKTRKIRDPQREMRDPRPEERRRQQILLLPEPHNIYVDQVDYLLSTQHNFPPSSQIQ